MDDDEGGPAAAVNPQLIGARSAQDSLRSYELSTGFHCSRNGRTPAVKPPLNHLSSTESTPIDLAELHETWAGWVEGLLGGVLKEPPARAEGGERQALPETPARGTVGSGPSLPSPLCTPSTDIIDLTSDSGHSFDADSVSSLASPVPTSPSPSPVVLRKPLGAYPHRLVPLLPRIRRLSTTSLPTTSFPSPSVSPGPLDHSHLSYPSSLSLDLDYPSSTPEEEDDSSLSASSSNLAASVSEIHSDDAKDAALVERSVAADLVSAHAGAASPATRVRKTKTRALVDQMRRAAEQAREFLREDNAHDHPNEPQPAAQPSLDVFQQQSARPATPASSPSKSAPPKHGDQPIYVAAPSFVRPPRAPTALPRCSDDLKDDDFDWWVPHDLAPSSAAHSRAPHAPTLHPHAPMDGAGWMFAPDAAQAQAQAQHAEAFNMNFRFPMRPAAQYHSVTGMQAPPQAQAQATPALTPDDFPALPSTRSPVPAAASVAGAAPATPARKRGKKAKKGSASSSLSSSLDGKPAEDEEKKGASARATPKKGRTASGASVQSPAGKSQAPSPASQGPRAFAPAPTGLPQQLQYPQLFPGAPQPGLPHVGYAPAMGVPPGYGYAPQHYPQVAPPPFVTAGYAAYAGYPPHALVAPPAQSQAAFAGFVQAQAHMQHARVMHVSPGAYGMYAAQMPPPPPPMGSAVSFYPR